MTRALLVDDNDMLAPFLNDRLPDITLLACTDPSQALPAIARENPELVLLDLHFPGDDGDREEDFTGFRLLREIRRQHPNTAVLVFTDKFHQREIPEELFGEVQPHGQFSKSEGLEEAWVNDLMQAMHTATEAAQPLTAAQKGELGFIVGQTQEMQMATRMIPFAASQKSYPVTIYGAKGTGRRLFARAIHRLSKCAGKLVSLDCKGLELESLEEGAAQAKNGVLYLRNIQFLQTEDLHQFVQKLSEDSDIHLIVSTEYSYNEILAEGEFPEELADRLHKITISLPLLQNRQEDIAELVHHKLQGMGNPLTLPDETLKRLRKHVWPNNIQELNNVIQRAAQHALANNDRALAPEYINIQEAEPPEQGVRDFLQEFDQIEDRGERYHFLLGLRNEDRPNLLIAIIRRQARNLGTRPKHSHLAKEISGSQQQVDAVRRFVCDALRQTGYKLTTLPLED